MRLIRVHVDDALAAGARIALRGTAAAHVRRVLRLETGDAVTLFNGDGSDYPARIGAMHRDAVEVEVTGSAPARAESPLAVTLVQGIARTERMDLVVQKATELGVAAIVPVATARGVVKLDADSRARKSVHWRGIAIAACEQCGRAVLPRLAEPMTLGSWLSLPVASGTRRLLLSADAEHSLVAAAKDANQIELLVGPEGGWTDAEVALAGAAGARLLSLGHLTLRADAVPVAAISVLQFLWDQPW